jgi:signal transduction histidine kinase
LRLRDMTRQPAREDIAEYHEEINRLHADLQDAIDEEEKLAPATRRADQHAELIRALKQFWQSADEVFAAASAGHEAAARTLAATRLFGQQAALAARVSHLLEHNNAAEQRADQKVASIYEGVERDQYAFLAATIVAILMTSLYLIYSNRRTFEKIESLSRQRRILAARLITVQEEVLRSVSRELHDEFGQILTAVGAMLARAERKGVPADSPLRTELSEVREITHNALEKVRSVSQMLHPAVIDDYGLVKGIEWYTDIFEKQTGMETNTSIVGKQVRIIGQPAIHCFRIVQEALNNAAKHSETKTAEVEMIFSDSSLTVNVKDFGRGLPQTKKPAKRGLGFIAMRERAELLGGSLEISSSADKGTTVCLKMPLQQKEDRVADPREVSGLEEVISPRT